MQSFIFELAARRPYCVHYIIIHYTLGTLYKQRQQEKKNVKNQVAVNHHFYNRDPLVIREQEQARREDDILQQIKHSS